MTKARHSEMKRSAFTLNAVATSEARFMLMALLRGGSPIASTQCGGGAERVHRDDSYLQILKEPELNTQTIRKASDPAIDEAMLRVEGQYREMPGLSLTLRQAARLWGLNQSTCERVLARLVERRVLKRAWNGAYVRA